MHFYTPEQDAQNLKPTGGHTDGLPEVLLIGDSISIGYTQAVRALLKPVCNVHRPAVNCGDTNNGLANLDGWLAGRVWDLIHFNWGLHDLCYRLDEAADSSNKDKINGTQSVEVTDYQANLETLVRRMQPHAKRLIWASTTYIPEGEAGRFQGDEARYNAAAAKVMQAHGIPVDDLCTLTREFPPGLFIGPGDVHYTPEGSARIAEAVADCISRQLKAGG